MKLFIRMDFPPFFVNIFIFYVNIWIVNVCTECVVGMYFKKECIRVWNYGVEAIFFIYIGNYIILFMFVLLHCYCFFDFWGGGHNFLHLLYSLVHHFPVEGEEFMQQYSKSPSQTFRCQVSKACQML